MSNFEHGILVGANITRSPGGTETTTLLIPRDTEIDWIQWSLSGTVASAVANALAYFTLQLAPPQLIIGGGPLPTQNLICSDQVSYETNAGVDESTALHSRGFMGPGLAIPVRARNGLVLYTVGGSNVQANLFIVIKIL